MILPGLVNNKNVVILAHDEADFRIDNSDRDQVVIRTESNFSGRYRCKEDAVYIKDKDDFNFSIYPDTLVASPYGSWHPEWDNLAPWYKEVTKVCETKMRCLPLNQWHELERLIHKRLSGKELTTCFAIYDLLVDMRPKTISVYGVNFNDGIDRSSDKEIFRALLRSNSKMLWFCDKTVRNMIE
jgi:hypothetical protein